jgi:phage repressor protein C with HTH and peptisase S24 domain
MVGDSMEPIIRGGPILAIDLDDTQLARRGIHAVVTPDGVWAVKHLRRSGDMLILVPGNSGTDDAYLLHIDLKETPRPIAGRVVCVG